MSDYRFSAQRGALIEEIRGRGVTDLELLRLFDLVPRHLFLPEGVWNRAYEDAPLPIGYGQTASQPSLQARSLQALSPGSGDRVLEIGTGSGFFTALLSRLSDRVFSVERIRELSLRARKALDGLEIRNVALLVGDGSIGWRKYAPFDVITVAAASPSVPAALVDQLAPGGRLLLPVGTREAQDMLLVTRDSEGELHEEVAIPDCTFVPLLGRYGWSDEEPGGRR
ncbi:MAG: protein-L-isoaspartate(D-aspartate) O-methyltransferase [Gemmatimonadales bacterium]|nr:MAG: protein-L-isoaspartate(D-aspartate) O-methyltransferase [Gemmatimonadales bacterium]